MSADLIYLFPNVAKLEENIAIFLSFLRQIAG